MEENILKEKLVNEVSIEIISKSIIKEANVIGFQRGDYIKLANLLLDSALKIDAAFPAEEKKNSNGYKSSKKMKLPLSSENVTVREFDKKNDSDLIRKWLTDENGRYFILTRATSRAYDVDRLIEDDRHVLGIITAKDKTPIGLMAYLDFDKEQQKAELRKLIGNPDYRGKGLGKETTKLWIKYGVANLNLTKIYLNTLQTNVRNIRLNEELGFKVEGILRKECLIDGKHHDLLRMGLVVE